MDAKVHADYEAKKAAALKAIADLTAGLRTKAIADVKAKPEAYFDALCRLEFDKNTMPRVLSDTKLRKWPSTHWFGNGSIDEVAGGTPDAVLGPLAKVAAAPAAQQAALLKPCYRVAKSRRRSPDFIRWCSKSS